MHRKDHLVGLNVLRALAVLGVFVFHAFGMAFSQGNLPWKGLFPNFSEAPSHTFALLYFLRIGSAGVGLFFVLSGYCIHRSILVREQRGQKFNAGSFFWRRLWRIYPPFLVSLIAFSFLTHPAAKDFIIHVLFLFNLHVKTFESINGSYWSLPVEFHLYLLYPVFLWMRAKWGLKPSLLVVALVTIIFHHGVRQLFAAQVSPLEPSGLAFSYWAFWCAGAALAELHLKEVTLVQRPLVLALACVPLCIATKYVLPLSWFLWWITTATSVFLIDYAVKRPWNIGNPFVKAANGLGLISYSIYLWHQPLLSPLSHAAVVRLGLHVSAATLFAMALTVVLGAVIILSTLSYRFVELPSISIGDMLAGKMPRRRRELTAENVVA